MFVIPGQIIALLTFPGVIVHEFAHQLFCRWQRVAVLDVCYFRFGNPAGYVVHEIPRRTTQQILIAVGPFLVNTILGAVIAFPAVIPVLKFGVTDPVDYVLMWLGVSIAMHAFPSRGDAKGIWHVASGPGIPWFAKLFAAPIAVLLYIVACGSYVWLDLVYGIGITIGLPDLVTSLLA